MAIHSDSLVYFCEVVAAGSIQTAARNVVIAPSALSRQIRLLEREVGVSLFQRTSQGMVPTAAGMELYDLARRQRAETVDIIKRIRLGTSDEPSDFRIACVEGVLTHLLPRWVPVVRKRHPGVRFTVEVMASAEVAAAVSSGEADVGYTFGRMARADLMELATMPMPIRLAIPREHQLATQRIVTLGQLTDELCVVPARHFGIRRELDRECARARIDLNVAYETNSLAFALRLVQIAGLVSFTTLSMALPSAEGPLLLPLVEQGFNSSAVALVSHATPSSARTSALRHELSDLMRFEAQSMNDEA